MTKRQVQLLVLFCLIVSGLALRFAMSWFSLANLPPSTDESISQLLADSISRGESYPLLFTGQPYQFPLEAYLMSVFSESLPNNAFGTRLQPIVSRLVTLLILCAVTITILDKNKRLPTLALILIPSAYWLIYQSGYFVPQHTVFALLSSLIFVLAIRLNRQAEPAILLTAVIGILSGLAISNHLLALSVVTGAFLIVVFTGSMWRSIQRIPVFGAGLLIGLVPYFLAVHTIDGAYDAIIGRLDLEVFLHRLFSTVIGRALPGAMGVYPPVFPDFPVHISWGIPLRLPFLAGFLSVFISCILVRLYKFFQNSMEARWPRLEWPDMFVVITAASIVLMALNSTSHWTDHRYLEPAVWSFPFLLGYAYSWRSSLARLAVGGFTVALVTVNLVTGVAMIDEWRHPGRIQHHADIPELAPTTNWMQAHNIHHCYASFWLAYRVNYESSGNITCGPVYNERFTGWPVPYKDEVDQHTRVAYLLSHTHGTKYSYIKFEKILKDHGVAFQRHNIGDYYAYHDFVYSPAEGETILPTSEYEIGTNIDQAQPGLLVDGDMATAWVMKESQNNGQYIEVAFRQQQLAQRVDIVHPLIDAHPANTVRILGNMDDTWIPLADPVDFHADRFSFYNNHPVLGEFSQTIRFDPQWLDAIRIELVSPRPDKPWMLSEIRIGVHE